MTDPVLRMDGVGVSFPTPCDLVCVLEDLTLDIHAGEMLALVGESGSGKSTAALSVPRLLPNGAVLSGSIAMNGHVLTGLQEASMRRLRGRAIGMMFQDSLAALNPSHSIGRQIAEPAMLHLGLSRRGARARAIDLLEQVGIPDAATRTTWYPHQFSGGMRQRAMLAIALSCDPLLLIADEPTTGLDAALKTQVLELIGRLRQERRLAVLLVSHDLALVRRHADTVQVLYAGRVVERGPARFLFAQPRHPYTRALLQAAPGSGRAPIGLPGQQPEPQARPPGCNVAPRCSFAQSICTTALPVFADGQTAAACFFPLAGSWESGGLDTGGTPKKPIGPALLHAQGITVHYRTSLLGRSTAPVQTADLVVAKGECVAVIGGSGSGKSTFGRALLQILPFEGQIRLQGQDIGRLRGAARRAVCRRIGAVFQDPANALHPMMTVARLIGEGMVLGGERRVEVLRRRAAALLDTVGLPDSLLDRRIGTLSGGQAQRVAIARALAAEPDLLVLDEPTSCLDVSSQAIVLTLLRDLGLSRELSIILLTHDLAAVRFLADRVLEMHEGRLREALNT